MQGRSPLARDKWELTPEQAQLAAANFGLVPLIAKRFCNAITPIDELISYGCEGLIRACRGGFDASRGYKFSTYACKAIYYAIWSGIRREARLSQAAGSTGYDDAVFEAALVDARDRVDLPEICEHLTGDDVMELLKLQRPVSARVFVARVLEGKTLREAAAQVGLSKQRTHQLQRTVTARLRVGLTRLVENR